MKQRTLIIQIILTVLSVLLSFVLGLLLQDGDDEFINTSNGSTGPGLTQFVFWFIMAELLFLCLIWGIPILFEKKDKS